MIGGFLFAFFNIMPSSLNRSVGNRAVIANGSPRVTGARATPRAGPCPNTTSFGFATRTTDTKPTAPRALGRSRSKDSAMDRSIS